jgi:hypothetical protein
MQIVMPEMPVNSSYVLLFHPSCTTDKLHNKDGSEPNPLFQVSKEAHAGFLHAAIALKDTVFKHIDDSTRNNRIKHVIFTGHSAGGAVASLLCLSYRASNQNSKIPAQ